MSSVEHPANYAEFPNYDVSPVDHHLWSWRSLHAAYEKYAPSDHRMKHIVRRLVDSEAARRFTVGEAFLFGERQDGRGGRGLYITTGYYGAQLHKVPHVVAYASEDKSMFFVEYCHGMEVLSSHICEWGKEVPCVLSLLELLGAENRDTDSAGESAT